LYINITTINLFLLDELFGVTEKAVNGRDQSVLVALAVYLYYMLSEIKVLQMIKYSKPQFKSVKLAIIFQCKSK